MIVESTSLPKVYVGDRIEDYVITDDFFRHKMFIKRKELSINELYFWNNDTFSGREPGWSPAFSPFIINNFDNIPDTIFADGFFALHVNAFWGMMNAYNAHNIRILTYQVKQVNSK